MSKGAGAAKRSRLAWLHQAFTEALIDELQQAKEDNLPLPAADKSVIAKFLKDNDITADAEDAGMRELQNTFEDELAAKREERRNKILQTIQENNDGLEGVL